MLHLLLDSAIFAVNVKNVFFYSCCLFCIEKTYTFASD